MLTSKRFKKAGNRQILLNPPFSALISLYQGKSGGRQNSTDPKQNVL